MKLLFTDKYIGGPASFQEQEGGYASMSYLSEKGMRPPLGTTYQVGDKVWKLVSVKDSDFNKNVVNLTLQLVRA